MAEGEEFATEKRKSLRNGLSPPFKKSTQALGKSRNIYLTYSIDTAYQTRTPRDEHSVLRAV